MERATDIRHHAAAHTLDTMVPLPYRVRQTRRETHDTFSFLIEPTVGAGIGHFRPGQFNMLYAYGLGESAISISADPHHPEKLWHTIRRVGVVTNGLARLKRGDMLGVRGPYGSHWPIAEARGDDVLIVAGGIGLAPLRPVIYHVLRHRADYRDVFILYGARTPDDLLYRRQMEEWRGRFDFQVDVTVDSAPRTWRGEVGVVTELLPAAHFRPDRTTAFICGPEIMMRFVAIDLQQSGVPDDHVYLSMERNMKCAIGFCGHCQYGSTFICKEGPVYRYDRIRPLLTKREI